ncbi:Outer membrane protein TolC [Rhodanobacter sp. Root179]|jgi:outer membrane protein|uniref:TolC family outer membrane protein n=1 Tax=unclassified Rhodanobacter TaxID=2621553 RepID=UPI0006F22F01|nr:MULTISPECIES: TolC family outer membrane protein [unclassified Rhodanobacter]KQZ68241.1 type I secretion protein TolC [Rhodanobacter sp. Root561]KRB38266.1 type I secretion protein TolC [Rhodanobacter sp. Root179]QRP63575.1 TolC family outer membrane protein [Rhodanobacter sp. FDAARGOS 1247]
MRLKLLTLALALAAISLPSHGEDLLDAYREARNNDPVLSQADASRLATGEGVTQARASLLPQIGASMSLNQTNGGGQIGHSRSRTINGTLSQSVLDFSKYANLKAAHSASEAQDELYASAGQQLYVRVVAAYFGVLTSEDGLTYAKANEDAFRQQYEQSDQRFKVGLSAITDVYQAKAYYEAAKSQTIAAQNTLNDSREALAQITGKPTGDLKKLRDDLPMQPPSPADQDAWVKQALETNPDLLAQKSNVETAQHNISAARAAHLPTITAGVSYGKGAGWSEGNAAARYRDPASTTIGLTLNVPIFSGGATQSLVRQSIYQRDGAADALEAQRRQVVRDTLNYYRSVIAGIAQVESAKASVESGRKALEATRAGFEVGTQTMTNVLLAIQTLTSSESSYSQARHQFILNKLLLKQTAGTADVKDIEQINALLQ